MNHSLRAFRHRNFRLFFVGQSVSLVGTWTQGIALSWLVYRMTGSAWLLGLTGFATQIPILVFAPLAGTLADRMDRRRLLTAVQIAALVQALVLALLTVTGVIAVWHIITLAFVQGIIGAADTPLRQTFLPEMVPAKEDLPAAVAFSAFMQNAGRLIGPTVAAALLAVSNEATCFLVNAGTKLVVTLSIVIMTIPRRTIVPSRRSVFGDIREGWVYAAQLVPVRFLLPMVACVSFMATPYQTLMPIIAAEVFGAGAGTYGVLIGAAGLGGTSIVVWIASRKSILGLPRVLATGTACSGVALIVFSLSPWLWLSLFLMFVNGAGLMTVITSTSTILHTIVEDSKRGRVMSIYTMCFLGVIPLGALASGALATAIGARETLALGGVFCLAGSAIFFARMPALRRHLEPIYRRLGIAAR